MKHFLSIVNTPSEQIRRVIDVAFELRRQRLDGRANDPILTGKTLAMIFEKPSLRTRVSFEQAMLDLGGHAILLRSGEVGLGTRESSADVARVLSGMVHGIMARVYEHEKLQDLASHSAIPVINALSDRSHPAQVLADMMTLMDEFGRDLTGKTLAYIGDGNNVARSLAMVCGKLGLRFHLACPSGYTFDDAFLEKLKNESPGLAIMVTEDPAQAVKEADALYTDTWVSMGQEDETAARRAIFADYQINSRLLETAPPHAVVLHCLPAYRNLEITDDVIDGPRSRVFPQAHNRLHAQKGLLAVLMGGA